MLFEQLPDRLADSWTEAMGRIATATPKGWHAERGGAVAVVTRAAVSSLNAVWTLGPEPDLAALDELGREVAGLDVPWSMIVRAAGAEPAAEVAARHGLTVRGTMPLMACAAVDAVRTVDPARAGQVETVDARDSDLYTAVLTEGFEAPAGTFGSLMGGGVLDAPGITGYLARVAGRPVATGLGIAGEGVTGIFNISVVPAARGTGLGRAMTVRAMVDGFDLGSELAYLHTSAAGRPLYESIGFRVVETWATFSAPEATQER